MRSFCFAAVLITAMLTFFAGCSVDDEVVGNGLPRAVDNNQNAGDSANYKIPAGDFDFDVADIDSSTIYIPTYIVDDNDFVVDTLVI